MHDQTELEETLQRAAAGEEGAWRVIVDAYASRVFGLLHAQCHNSDLAEEIAQSTFCTVAAKIGSYTELGRFESWLFRIAMNRLRDEMRRRRRQAVAVEEETLAGFADGAGEAPDRPDAEELAALRQVLVRLPEADRRVIHLRHFGNLSFKQIAEVLEQPLGTVLARHHRALQKLREWMGGG